jgi:hypothetical protein
MAAPMTAEGDQGPKMITKVIKLLDMITFGASNSKLKIIFGILPEGDQWVSRAAPEGDHFKKDEAHLDQDGRLLPMPAGGRHG